MKQGVELITEERERQVNKHGYTVPTDLVYNKQNELQNAMVYLLTGNEDYFPSTWDRSFKQEFDEYSHLKKLMVVGAWAAAAIDRYQFELYLDKYAKTGIVISSDGMKEVGPKLIASALEDAEIAYEHYKNNN